MTTESESRDEKSPESQLADIRQVIGPSPMLGCEDQRHYDEIMTEFLKSFAPQGFMQQHLLTELTDCTWHMARCARHTALLMERRLKPRLAFQAERQQTAATNKGTGGGAGSDTQAEHNHADLTEPMDAFEGLIEEVDTILLKRLPEVDHFRALEVALTYQDQVAREFSAAAARRDDILERIEYHRPFLSDALRGVSDEIIARFNVVRTPQGAIPKEKRARTSSQRKVEANRTNGRKSRGPATAEGKVRSSRNALRHGLATITRHNPKHFPDIERMAEALCNGDDNPLLFEQAIIIAENELVLRCVSVERVAAIERMRDITARPLTRRDNSVARAKARFRAAKLKYAQLLRAKANKEPARHEQNSDLRPQDKPAQPVEEKPRKSRDDHEAMCLAKPDLDRLARYERRAWSRQKRAVRAFIQIKSSSAGMQPQIESQTLEQST